MKYISEASQVIYEHAVEMFKIGAITEARMREYDEMCLKNPKVKKSSSVPTGDNTVVIKQINHATV